VKQASKSEFVGAKVPAELAAELRRAAVASGRSMSAVTRGALYAYLSKPTSQKKDTR
jgi:hypothetical protein